MLPMPPAMRLRSRSFVIRGAIRKKPTNPSLMTFLASARPMLSPCGPPCYSFRTHCELLRLALDTSNRFAQVAQLLAKGAVPPAIASGWVRGIVVSDFLRRLVAQRPRQSRKRAARISSGTGSVVHALSVAAELDPTATIEHDLSHCHAECAVCPWRQCLPAFRASLLHHPVGVCVA